MVPSLRDKIVQEGMRVILETVFEHTFSAHSHGFRTGKGSHTALKQTKKVFGGVKWFLEATIKSNFPSVDQKMLRGIVTSGINDSKFIDLLNKAMKAGQIDIEGSFQRKGNPFGFFIYPQGTGIPEGSIISPILSNIQLRSLDRYIESQIRDFRIGGCRKANPEQTKLIRFKDGEKMAWKDKINPEDLMDAKQKGLAYVRQIDNLLIGVIGSKDDSLKVRADLKNFLADKLKLELHEDKKLVTHAVTGRVRFLGQDLHITPQGSRRVTKRSKPKQIKEEVAPSRIQSEAPIKVIVNCLKDRGFCKGQQGNPTRVGKLIYLSETEILAYYRAVEDGLLNYYSLASNQGRFAARIHYILKQSCILTLASKLRIGTKAKVIKRFGLGLRIPGPQGDIVAEYPTPSQKTFKKPVKESSYFNPTESTDTLLIRKRKSLKMRSRVYMKRKTRGICTI